MRASFLVDKYLVDRPFCILNPNDSCFIDNEVGRRGGCS